MAAHGDKTSIADALGHFMGAFDALMSVDGLDVGLCERLKSGLFRAFTPAGGIAISVYEVGLWHDPARGYVMNEKKFADCLAARPLEVATLFVDGVLPYLTFILRAYLTNDPPQGVYLAAIKLLGVCEDLAAAMAESRVC